MKKLVVLFVVGSVSALPIAAIAPASAKKTVWTAALSTGQEVPKQVVKDAAAHGQFKGTLNGNKLSWSAHLREADGLGDGRAHSHGSEGSLGARRRPVVRALHERAKRHRNPQFIRA